MRFSISKQPAQYKSKKMKYLITGANGQVGSQLVAQLQGKAEIFAADRATLD
ncbi:sugar nucleotide-binding protein, partial [Kingella kingae]|nr:sugar nucleotide-binding protein [Kingella kingae]